MSTGPIRVVLGSGSPRRRRLLDQMGVAHVVRVADVDERTVWTDDVTESARRSARVKFDVLAADLGDGELLITADTLVHAGGRPLGKPRSVDEARRMIREVSDSDITIVTAVIAGRAGHAPEPHDTATVVRLRQLDTDEIETYLATGTAMDKAGALELQGAASSFVESVHGCWSNVVGLPVCVVTQVLERGSKRRCSGDSCGRVAE